MTLSISIINTTCGLSLQLGMSVVQWGCDQNRVVRKGPIFMNESEISQYITETFESVDVVVASGDSFFFYNPDRSVAPDHRFMFATIVTSDINDQFSDLNRPSVFRLNIGIG